MSAIGSISGSAQAQQLQDLRRQADQGGGGIPDEAFSQAAQAAGLDPSKVDDVKSQIQAAVQQAIQGSSGGDRRAAVENAVDGVLKDNGVDPTAFKKQLQAAGRKHRAHHGHRPHQARPQQQTSSTDASAEPSDGVTDPSANGEGLNVLA